MTVQEDMCAAIARRAVVRITRAKDPPGTSRIGEPHIVYESSAGNVLVDLYQTGGYSSSEQPLMWRPIALADVRSVVVLDDRFEPRPTYNPRNRSRYRRIICAV
jgi:hypothetical protein